MNACSALLAQGTGVNAEGYAASIDVAQAGYELELAIHASDPGTCAISLQAVSQLLRYAQTYYGATGDEQLADQAGCAASQAATWAGEVPSDPAALMTWQGQVLYPFHGVLSALAGQAAYQQIAGFNEELVAFAGAGAVLLLSALYLAGRESTYRGGRWTRPAAAGKLG